MVWLAVNKDGSEVMLLCNNCPHRISTGWWAPSDKDYIINYDIHYLDDGFIEKHLGRKLTWEHEPVKFNN